MVSLEPVSKTRFLSGFRGVGYIPSYTVNGRIRSITGLSIEIVGLTWDVSLGDRIALRGCSKDPVVAEIVSFRLGAAWAMVQGSMEGLGPGSTVQFDAGQSADKLTISDEWIGRVVDPLGRALDGRGPLLGGTPRSVRASAPPAALRARLGPRIDLGVRALNAFATCRTGQRLGLFAGSGVGKSTLLGMLARNVSCDVTVLALVGERGREVREFLDDELGPKTRTVTVVATSDTPPLVRREAAYAAMAVAEHFRDEGRSVLLLMDSITRFCLALREIALSTGELPSTRGYPASVFAELPRLLERAGPGTENPNSPADAQITAIFTVLVEGDDHDEPVTDAVRGMLDGHIILDRRIAGEGRFPAVDVLRSLSRTVPGCLSRGEAALVRRARGILARYEELADLVRLGAYRPGSDPVADEAIALGPQLTAWLVQDRQEQATLESTFIELATMLKDSRL
jgi:flagellum-specific ATP synthase